MGDEVVAARCRLRLHHNHALHQHHVLIELAVIERGHDDGQDRLILRAQTELSLNARAVIVLVQTEDIACEITLALFGTGGLIEDHLLDVVQEHGDRVDDRRLTGTIVARHQDILAAKVHRLDAIVEATPVVNVHALETEAVVVELTLSKALELLIRQRHDILPGGKFH